MKPRILIGILMGVGAVAVGGITYFGKIQTTGAPPAGDFQGGSAPGDSARAVRVDSDACRSTTGEHAALYCNGLPPEWAHDPDIDMEQIARTLQHVGRCGQDALVEVHRLPSREVLETADVKDLICSVVASYPPMGTAAADVDLQDSMDRLINDYVNR